MLGITKIIKKTFVPHFKFKNLQNVPKNVGGLKKRAACTRGKLIDRELNQFVVNGQVQSSFCTETNLILNKLNELKLKPILSQHHISNANLKMCTFIDLVAICETSCQTMIIEIKRGCHYKLCSTQNGSLRFHDPIITDCMQHQHELQALLSKMLYEIKYEEKCECCLIYVDELKCEYIPENKFAAQISKEALDAITNTKIIKKRKR